MPRSTPKLLALLPAPLLHARLQKAMHGDARWLPLHWALHPVRDWRELTEALKTGAVEALIADPYAGAPADGALNDLCWAEAAHRAPDAVMIAYGDFPRYPARDVLRLAASGVHEVVTVGMDDDPFTFHQLLAGAASAALARRVVNRLGEQLDLPLARLLRELLGRAHLPLTPHEAARLYHTHPKTLNEHLRRAALPPLSQLIIRCRLLQAARLLGAPGSTLEAVTRKLLFPSAAALRAQLSRHLDVSPSELRRRGAAEWAIDEFCRRCRTGEWEAREGCEDGVRSKVVPESRISFR